MRRNRCSYFLVPGLMTWLSVATFNTAIHAQGEASVLERRVAELGGYQLSYQQSGSGEATIVFIHGGGDVSAVWTRVMAGLPAGVTGIAIDSPGRGYSDWGHRRRTHRQIATDFHRLLKQENIRGPHLLVAHSLGAITAQYFARDFPNDVSGVVLVDPTPLDRLGRYGEKGNYSMARDRDLARDLEVPSPLTADAQVEEATEKFTRTRDFSQLAKFLSPEEVSDLEQAANRIRFKPDGAEFNHYWSEELRDLHGKPGTGWLGDRPIRVLYIPADFSMYPESWFSNAPFSKESAKTMTEESIESYTRASTNGRATIVNCGHYIHIERPELVLKSIAEVMGAKSGE